ncbi:MAG: PDDEXK nuclease domain-containing protein [Cyanobacteria bacterium P01_F01_bin.150]
MAKQSSLFPDDNYAAFLDGLKQRIRKAQIKAALAVNQELVLLYWTIGKDILAKQQTEGWGSKVIDRLAKDLKQSFPDIKGFSARNLKYMRSFAEAWPDKQIVQQLVAQIPWGHNVRLLDTVKSSEERRWYVEKTIKNSWSRNVLMMQIDSDLYERQGRAITNFEQTLPEPQSDLAQSLLKSEYNFDFLSLGEEAQERELEKALVERIKEFLLELGVGFAFVGSQYHLEIEDDDYYLDLLFYHLQLRCYVVIDLKVTEFKPEYTGKMNFYVSAVDDLLKHADDQPTIGIILCRSKKKTVAEYSLRNVNTPIAVSTHKLPKTLRDRLPTAEQLEMEIDLVMKKIEGEKP